ncbi:MAG: peptidase S15, partial [Actinomycetota bacterium]|nr:peptidase S15 [Actinomycetota bacterium]
MLGAPQLTFNYTGRAPDSDVRVLAQILDRTTDKVLGNQITPIPATLDGHSHSVGLPLEMITATATHHARLTLQL